MTDTTSGSASRPGERLSLSKSAGAPAGATGAGDSTPPRRPGLFSRSSAPAEPIENVAAPLTVKIVGGALLVVVVCQILTALLFRVPGYVNQLTGVLAKSNADAKKPKQFFDSLDALHTVRTSYAIQAAVIGVALVLLAWAMNRTRSASGSRWALLIIVVFTGLYNTVVPGKGLPGPIQVVGVISGAAAILALILTFVPPPSQRYFRACKLASQPAATRGQARPGLGALFGPKRPRNEPAPAPAATRSATTRSTTRSSTDRASAAKAKAKVRADSDAVARGAELARSRAKASKSRRTGE